jgi:tetratricopeptide (TPR) repeat protein
MDAIPKSKKLFLSFIFICFSLILFRPFVVNQIIARGDGYLGYTMYKDAVREYKKALALDSDNSMVMNWLGYAYECMGDADRAISIYKKAIEIDSEDIIANHDLGMIYAKDKKFEAAKEYFLKASSITQNKQKHPDEEYAFYHFASLKMLSICQEKLGEISGAIETNEKILKYYPDRELKRERLRKLHGRL